MPTTRVNRKHQITIPKQVFEAAGLEIGDVLDARVQSGKVVFMPKRQKQRRLSDHLSSSEKRALTRARKKINKMVEDLPHSRGMTRKEVNAAVKAGLIPQDQAYFWTEEWQKDERASERDKREGRLSGSVETAKELQAELDRLKQRA